MHVSADDDRKLVGLARRSLGSGGGGGGRKSGEIMRAMQSRTRTNIEGERERKRRTSPSVLELEAAAAATPLFLALPEKRPTQSLMNKAHSIGNKKRQSDSDKEAPLLPVGVLGQ